MFVVGVADGGGDAGGAGVGFIGQFGVAGEEGVRGKFGDTAYHGGEQGLTEAHADERKPPIAQTGADEERVAVCRT